MNIVLTSDKVKPTTDLDEKYLNDIASILKQYGHTVNVYLPIDPNSHVSGMQAAADCSLVVDFFGGACAGTLNGMGSTWFKGEQKNRQVFVMFIGGAINIKELDWLPRAYDDDFSPASFTGLANPDQYLYTHGIGFNYATDANDAALKIINVAGGTKSNNTPSNIVDVSDTDGYVTQEQFINMADRVSKYINSNKVNPSIVYTIPNGNEYVKWATYEDMFNRWTKYHDTNGVWATVVYFKGPSTPPMSDAEALLASKTGNDWYVLRTAFNAVGEFTTFTQFYNQCKGRGYLSYYNDIYDQATAFERLSDKSGLNCSDVSQLGYEVAKAIGGYSVRYLNVQCKQSGGHVRLQVKGNELGTSWVNVDLAAAISVSSQYPIGQVWCSDGTILSYDDAWLISDDGIT